MTILGKILAFLNIIAAATFVYFAALDLGQRQAWQYAAFRHQLVLDGLPIDENAADPILDVRTVDRLSDATLRNMFSGNPVRTQQEEVRRVHNIWKAELAKKKTAAEKRQYLLANLFLPLARSSLDRYAVRERFADEKNPVDPAKELDAVFEDALSGEINPNGPTPPLRQAGSLAERLLPRDKRAAIAHLLFVASPDPDRVQVVIGIPALLAEVEHQADLLQTIAEQQRFALLGDRADFEIRYKSNIEEMRGLADSLQDRKFTRANHQTLFNQHEKLKERRLADVKEVEANIDAARVELKKLLDLQADEERILFEAHRVLGSIRAENERLERTIRQLEKVKP